MKSRKIIWITGGLSLLILAGFVVEKFIQDRIERNRLLHALDLNELPGGTRIVATAEDIWTDYIVHFVVRLEEGKIDEFLSGRDFKAPEFGPNHPYRTQHEGYTSHLPHFDVYHQYFGKDEHFGITVETDENGTWAYVVCVGD